MINNSQMKMNANSNKSKEKLTTTIPQSTLTEQIKPIKEQAASIVVSSQKHIKQRNVKSSLTTSFSHKAKQGNSSKLIKAAYANDAVMKKQLSVEELLAFSKRVNK